MPVSRRAFLAAGLMGSVALGATACSPPGQDEPHVDEEPIAAALAGVSYVAALAGTASAPQAAFLAWTAGVHDRHASLLARLIRSGVQTYDLEPLPADASAYGQVAREERELVERLRSTCRDAKDPAVARLLASIAAAASQQASVLEGLA